MFSKHFRKLMALAICVTLISCNSQTEDYNRASGGTDAPTPPPPGSMYGEEDDNAFMQKQSQMKQQMEAQKQMQEQMQAQQQAQQQNQQQAQNPSGAAVRTIGDEKTAHYTCPNFCAGSGADGAGNCPTCGTAYVHNTESPWHQANQQQNTTPETTINPQTNVNTPTPNNNVIAGDEKTSHYICSDACAGSGSPAPGDCPVCGKAYVHNSNSPAHEAELKMQQQQNN